MSRTADGNHTCTHDCQYFRFLRWAWCVTYAQQLIDADPSAAELVKQADISGMDPYVGLTETRPNAVSLFRYEGLNPEHAATVDLSKPILIASIFENDGVTVASRMVIDGWHRIYRARTEGRDTLPALLLSPQTCAAIEVPVLIGAGRRAGRLAGHRPAAT